MMGTPSTNSGRRMEKVFGTSSYVLFNSETDLPYGRQGLTTDFGFNQKRFVFLSSTLNSFKKALTSSLIIL